MGKKELLETGAGQHGVASATVAAYDMECIVFMGEEDVGRQKPNVDRMKLLGAKVVPVSSGSKTLKDALNEAMRDWVTNVDDTFYIIGTVAGPHPYPMIVRDFNSIVGKEVLRQFHEVGDTKYPDFIVACVGGGSNALGIFYPFIDNNDVQLIGVEAGGNGINTENMHLHFAGKKVFYMGIEHIFYKIMTVRLLKLTLYLLGWTIQVSALSMLI